MNTTLIKRSSYSFNERHFQDTMARIRTIAPEMEMLAEAIRGTSIKVKTLDVVALLASPHNYLLRYLPEETQRFIENLEDVKSYKWSATEFHSLLQWVKSIAVGPNGGFVLSYWKLYDLKTGQLKEQTENDIREQCTARCESERQEKALQKIQLCVDTLNQLQEETEYWLDPYSDSKQLSTPFTREGRQYIVNSAFIQKFV